MTKILSILISNLKCPKVSAIYHFKYFILNDMIYLFDVRVCHSTDKHGTIISLTLSGYIIIFYTHNEIFKCIFYLWQMWIWLTNAPIAGQIWPISLMSYS